MEHAALDDPVQQLIAAVNDELVAALRRADALRAEAEAAREAVQSAAEERLRFFQYANHDMRSPLAVMLGQVQLAQRRLARGEYDHIATSLQKIELQARRLAELTDRVLRLSQVGGDRAESQLLDLAAVVTRSVERFRGSSSRHRISGEEIEAPLMVNADPREFDDLLENLLSNAVKYSPEGGAITVTARASRESDGPMAVVRVSDEGHGIPEEHQPLLFEPFYRAPQAREVSGSGLGLAICADILARHDGRIWLEESSEHGSVFAFAIPLASSPDA